jgi:hypothetical protein
MSRKVVIKGENTEFIEINLHRNTAATAFLGGQLAVGMRDRSTHSETLFMGAKGEVS